MWKHGLLSLNFFVPEGCVALSWKGGGGSVRNLLGSASGVAKKAAHAMAEAEKQQANFSVPFELPEFKASKLGYDPLLGEDYSSVVSSLEQKNISKQKLVGGDYTKVTQGYYAGNTVNTSTIEQIQNALTQQRQKFDEMYRSVSEIKSSLAQVGEKVNAKMKEVNEKSKNSALIMKMAFPDLEPSPPPTEDTKPAEALGDFIPIDLRHWNRRIPVIYANPDAIGDMFATGDKVKMEQKLIHQLKIDELLQPIRRGDKIDPAVIGAALQSEINGAQSEAQYYKSDLEVIEPPILPRSPTAALPIALA